MNLPAKFVGSLFLAATLAVSAVAADIQSFEFIGAAPGKNEKKTLVFEVKEASQVTGDNLHTVFVVKAFVIKSEIKELEKGAVFEGCFDRFYSIFDAPSSHPLKKGDRVEVGIIQVEKHTIIGFLKQKERANKTPEPTPPSGVAQH
jgi:hypothetical protein